MSFQADLKYGQEAERIFHSEYPDLLERLDGKEGDFLITATNKKIEFKVDKYCPIKYQNFIMERFRSGNKNGGPWQARDHGCTYYAYRFAKTGDTYLFNVEDLIERLEAVEYQEFKVGNGSYDTTYYKVPRNTLADLYLDVLHTLAPVAITPVSLDQTLLTHSLLTSDNETYHNNRTHLSSSSLKMLLKSPEQFYVEWVLGQSPPTVENPNFSEGSFVHSLILEPETISQYAIYPGLRKSGSAFEEFKAKNPNKTILSAAQVHRCEKLYKAYTDMPIALELLKEGLAEHTMLADILGCPIKTRADFINIPKGYIVDIKTTAGPTDIDAFKATVLQYSYELSAALYCEAARVNYNKLFDFYWLVLSKSDGQCAIYKASSDTLTFGAAMYTQAIVLYKKCLESGIWRKEQPALEFTSNYEILEI